MVEISKFSFSLKFKILFIVLTVNLSFIACMKDTGMEKTMEASFRLASNTLAGEAIDEKRQIRSILSDEAKARYSKTGETLNSIDSSYFPTKDRLNRIQQAFLKESMNQSQVSDSLKSAFVLIKGFIEDAVNSYSNLLNESGTLYGLREAETGNLVQKMKIRKDSTLLLLTPTKGFESMLWLAKCEMDMKRLHLEIVAKVGNMAGGRPSNCLFGIYPFVIPLQNCIKKGDSFHAAIGLMPYDLPFTPEDFQLFVDGKALKFTKGWYVEFEVPNVQKNMNVRISGLVRDKMTGEMLPAFSDVRYEVKVE